MLPGGGRAHAWGSEPPIAELGLWESHMLSSGQALCDYLAQLLPADQLLAATAYDAERVFYQIVEYTHDSGWVTCAQRAEAVYRDQDAFAAGGGVPGYMECPR